MKKNVLVIVSVLVVSLIACAQSKKATTKTSKKPDIEYVMMKRTACFGQCPMYYIELYKDGTLKYTGERFIKDSGVYEKNIGAANAEKLFNEFRKYRIDTCREQYDLPIADLPGIYYALTIDGTDRKIVNANFGPAFLKTLANKMDELGGKDIDHSKWKKLTPEK